MPGTHRVMRERLDSIPDPGSSRLPRHHPVRLFDVGTCSVQFEGTDAARARRVGPRERERCTDPQP